MKIILAQHQSAILDSTSDIEIVIEIKPSDRWSSYDAWESGVIMRKQRGNEVAAAKLERVFAACDMRPQDVSLTHVLNVVVKRIWACRAPSAETLTGLTPTEQRNRLGEEAGGPETMTRGDRECTGE